MNEQINPPHKSKINITALITWLVGGAVTIGLVPAEHKEVVLQFAVLVAPPLIMTFRTWFTASKGG